MSYDSSVEHPSIIYINNIGGGSFSHSILSKIAFYSLKLQHLSCINAIAWFKYYL